MGDAALNTWNAAIRTAIRLLTPKPLKEGADSLEVLAFDLATINVKHLEKLIDRPDFATPSVSAEPVRETQI